MDFKYCNKRLVIECPDESVSLKFHGFLPGRQQWILTYRGMKIGILMWTQHPDGPSKYGPLQRGELHKTHWLLSVCEPIQIWRDGVESFVTGRYKFRSCEEQDEVFGLIRDAFSCYDGMHDYPPAPVHVRYHPVLETRIARGRLLAQPKTTSPI
jgi:hypothetical protein